MDNESRKILITGGAGFIGSHLVDELVNRNFSVTVVDNLTTGIVSNIPPGISFYRIDIRDKELLKKVFIKEQPDITIHLAAQTSVNGSSQNPSYDCCNNIVGTINILECCKIFNVKKIIFASSAAVYGHSDTLPIREKNPLQPLSFYGLSKLTAEKYILLFSELFGIPFTILRYSNIYGERQNSNSDGGAISIFVNQVLNNKPVVIFGNGEQTRDFIYVKDVVTANVAAIDNGTNEIVNISSGVRISVNEVIKNISEVTKYNVNKKHTPLKPGEILHSQLCNEKAVTLLKWKPNYNFKEGLNEMLKNI